VTNEPTENLIQGPINLCLG
jgi:hypothetical protein